jgi:hypothetical protein
LLIIVYKYNTYLSSFPAAVVCLKSVSIEGAINGFVASVTSELTYFHSGVTPTEASFSFPVDDSSAVYRFEAQIEDRVIIAECQEKDLVRQPLFCEMIIIMLCPIGSENV